MASAQEDALSSLRADGALRTLLNLIPLLTTARAPSAAAVQPSLTFGLPAGGLAPRTSRWALARACGARLTRAGVRSVVGTAATEQVMLATGTGLAVRPQNLANSRGRSARARA